MARNLDAELRGRPLEAFTFQGVRRLGRDPAAGSPTSPGARRRAG